MTTNRTEFIQAARDQAFDAGHTCPTCDGDGTVYPGRRIVHCLGSFTGADWGEEGVIKTIQSAQHVEWVGTDPDYQLHVRDEHGKTWYFKVRKPAGATS